MQRLSIALDSKSAWGGSNGNALNGSLARHADRRLEDFLVEAMRETYVEPFDRSNKRVENFCLLRHDKEPCRLVQHITSLPLGVSVIRVEVQSVIRVEVQFPRFLHPPPRACDGSLVFFNMNPTNKRAKGAKKHSSAYGRPCARLTSRSSSTVVRTTP